MKIVQPRPGTSGSMGVSPSGNGSLGARRQRAYLNFHPMQSPKHNRNNRGSISSIGATSNLNISTPQGRSKHPILLAFDHSNQRLEFFHQNEKIKQGNNMIEPTFIANNFEQLRSNPGTRKALKNFRYFSG